MTTRYQVLVHAREWGGCPLQYGVGPAVFSSEDDCWYDDREAAQQYADDLARGATETHEARCREEDHEGCEIAWFEVREVSHITEDP